LNLMARLCERPGCSTPAEVAYGFDPVNLVVWLGVFDLAEGTRSGVLCLRHADAMVVPLGWMLDDRREPVPRLFKPAPAEDRAPRPRARRPRFDRQSLAELIEEPAQLSLDNVVEPVVVATSADEVETVLEPAPAPRAEPVPESVTPERVLAMVPEQSEPEVEAELDVVADVDTAEEPEPVEEPEQEATVLPWQPRFDQSDDLSGLLKARGRLLSRAFNGIVADEA
jgi:hypothetical protein